MSALLTRLHRQPFWIALLIFILLSLWVASGMLSADEPSKEKSLTKETPLAKVKVTRMQADQMSREITLYGRTEPNRSVTLRAEVQGQVTKIFAEEGQSVVSGQKLLELDDNDLKQRLKSAKSTLQQRKIELEGAQQLGQKGYQSKVTLAQSEANVEAAKAEVESLQLAIENTIILAPFDGVFNQRFVEVGDLLKDGDEIASIVDLNPLVISADITESHIQQLELGQVATGRIVSGERLDGSVRYISSVSNMGTNTFEIEVEVDNSDMKYMAGMSTELSIPLETLWAIKITPAVMALDESGNLGVKTIENERVKFTPIDMVKSDSQGVWLAGLGQQADVITLGHGFVRHGDQVDVVYSNEELQARQ